MPATIPIFVINLARSEDRRAHIVNEMQKQGLAYQLFEAVDGNAIGKSRLEAKYGPQLFQLHSQIAQYAQSVMSLGAVGCLLSHLKLYAHIIEKDIQVACILEDDAVLSDGFSEVLQSTVLHDYSWEILLLGHISMRHWDHKKGADASLWKHKVCENHYIARPAEFPFTTVGYLIKQSAAQKLTKYAYPLRAPADWITSNAELAGARLQMITPPCVTVNPIFRKSTTVEKVFLTQSKMPIVAMLKERGVKVVAELFIKRVTYYSRIKALSKWLMMKIGLSHKAYTRG